MADQEIAQLGISIDSSGVDEAKLSLDNLAEAATRAEASATSLARSQTQAMQAGVRQQQAQENFSKSAAAAAAATEKQQQELSKLLGQIDPVVAALERLDQQEEKLRGFRATGALDAETFGAFKATIDRNRDALSVFDDSLSRTGRTVGKTRQALQQLPAQFSDIFVSLQAGQSPFQVLLQQGTQIKDSFGSLGAALRATGTFAVGLVTPFSAAAAAVAALAFAYQQGSQEAVKFNQTIILTGNAVGTSAGQLQGMASAIDSVVGTQSKAAAVLAQVVQSGAFTVSQIQQVSQAAIALEEVTGKSVESTINEFKKLGDDPVRAVQELNEQYNFLTAATFDQISALQEQGDAAGAAQLAFDLFSDTLTSRSKEIEENLGFIETAWLEIKRGASEAWDEMLGIGRPETPDDRLSALARGESFNLGRLATRGLVLGPIGAAVEGFKQFQASQLSDEERATLIGNELAQIQARDEQAWQEGLARQLENDAIGAQARIDQLRTAGLSNAEKRKKALTDLARDLSKIRSVSPNDPRLDPANVSRLESDIEQRFADRQSRTPRTPAVRDDAATRLLLNLREQESALSLQLNTSEKLTAAEKERAKFIQQIADLQNKEVLTAEQKSLLANQDAIKAQLDKNVALESEIRLRDESLKLQERSEQLSQTIAAANESRAAQNRDILGTFGLGRQEREVVESFARIRKEFAGYRAELDKATPKNLLNSEDYKEAVAEIERQLQIALKNHEDYLRKRAEAEKNASKGAKEALSDYVTESQKTGKQVNELITDALGGIEDSFVELATTGKTSFRDLADSILADIARIGVRSLISNAIIGAGFGPAGAQQQGIDFGSIASSIAGLFGGGGSAGYTGAFGFEGGGFTGYGQRAGGLDGRGGFLAMVHPNETVIDHTKPGSPNFGGGTNNSVSIGNITLPGVTNAREGKRAAATIAREINSRVVGSARFA